MRLQSIRSLHSQFGPCNIQLAVNLVPAVNSLTKNVYVANGLHSWHITWLIKYFNCYLKCHINLIKIHHSRKKKKRIANLKKNKNNNKNQISICLHFGSSQFGYCHIQLAVNLISAINSLTKNAYVANGLHSWHITWLIKYFNCYLKFHINLIKIHHSRKKKKKRIVNLKKNKNNNKNQISICLDPRSSFQFFFFHAFSTFWDNYHCSRTVAALFTHCSWHITWLIKYFNCYLKCHVNLIKIHHARKKKIELLILKKIKTITKINLVFVWIHVHVFSFFFFFFHAFFAFWDN